MPVGHLQDFSAPRVQAHASAAVVNFSEGCEPDLMAPYLDTLISQLVALLQRGKKLVQEGALTALASVADCAQEAFVKYYDAVMPLLSTLLLNAQDKQYRWVGERWGVGVGRRGGNGVCPCGTRVL
jgi:hypothetical protein